MTIGARIAPPCQLSAFANQGDCAQAARSLRPMQSISAAARDPRTPTRGWPV